MEDDTVCELCGSLLCEYCGQCPYGRDGHLDDCDRPQEEEA